MAVHNSCITGVQRRNLYEARVRQGEINQSPPTFRKRQIAPSQSDRFIQGTPSLEGDLLRACIRGKSKTALKLIQAGALINLPISGGKTYLMIAVESGHRKLVKKLCSEGASLESKLPRTGETALHMAVRRGKKKIVKELIKHGASLYVIDRNGISPLGSALRYGFFSIARFLIKLGCSIDETEIEGSPAIHAAFNKNGLDKVRRFLELGADINLPDVAGNRILHRAVHMGNCSEVQTLIEWGANVNAFNQQKRGPFHLACLQGDLGMAQLLVQNGADESALDVTMKTGWQLGYTLSFPGFRGQVMSHPRSKINQDLNYLSLFCDREISYRLPGERTVVKIGGGWASAMYDYLANSLIALSKNGFNASMPLSSDEMRKTALAFWCGINTKAMSDARLSEIRNGGLCIVSSGWKEHSVCLALKGGYMAIGNRGMRPKDTPSLTVFRIDPTRISRDLLGQIEDRVSISEEEREAFIYRDLPGQLGMVEGKSLKDSTCMLMEKFSFSDQKSGSCSISSPMGVLPFVFGLDVVKVEGKDCVDEIRNMMESFWLSLHVQVFESCEGSFNAVEMDASDRKVLLEGYRHSWKTLLEMKYCP